MSEGALVVLNYKKSSNSITVHSHPVIDEKPVLTYCVRCPYGRTRPPIRARTSPSPTRDLHPTGTVDRPTRGVRPFPPPLGRPRLRRPRVPTVAPVPAESVLVPTGRLLRLRVVLSFPGPDLLRLPRTLVGLRRPTHREWGRSPTNRPDPLPFPPGEGRNPCPL